MRKYGFDEDMAKQVCGYFNNSDHLVRGFSAMSLHIKGMGFLRNEIVEVVSIFEEGSLDKANWQALQGIKSYTKDMETAIYAYKAGLTVNDVKQMNENELALDTLKVMATLKNL